MKGVVPNLTFPNQGWNFRTRIQHSSCRNPRAKESVWISFKVWIAWLQSDQVNSGRSPAQLFLPWSHILLRFFSITIIWLLHLHSFFFFSLSLLSSCWLSILPLKSNPAPSLMDNDIALIILNIDCSRVWQTGSWHPVSALSTIQFQPSQWILFKWSSRIARPITLFWCIYHRPFGWGRCNGNIVLRVERLVVNNVFMCICCCPVKATAPPRTLFHKKLAGGQNTKCFFFLLLILLHFHYRVLHANTPAGPTPTLSDSIEQNGMIFDGLWVSIIRTILWLGPSQGHSAGIPIVFGSYLYCVSPSGPGEGHAAQ